MKKRNYRRSQAGGRIVALIDCYGLVYYPPTLKIEKLFEML